MSGGGGPEKRTPETVEGLGGRFSFRPDLLNKNLISTKYYWDSFQWLKTKRRIEKLTNGERNGEADEQDFWTEKTMLSRKRRASKGEAKEMAKTEEGAVNGGKGRSLLLVLMF
ncbi:LOW QUALITY PROTEIN: hypothetical protein HID58_056441 [Brassica napus]|uniref:Uncharacterized protein n=1 Tax=Brassica napus TaxID=3708 RepID=A0ABQ8ANB6_BRANA|nr:LOW QUALITY PROTEIN: hypothetical protein HID58_056441 [Brassica napus]